MNRSELLDTAKQAIAVDRAATHGDAEDNFARIAGHWNWWLQDRLTEPITALDVAQMMAGLKQARAMENIHHEDNYTDAIGYQAIAGEISTGGKL